jgi:hypothetical protein
MNRKRWSIVRRLWLGKTMNTQKINLFGLVIKTSVVHTVTYFIMGFIAFNFLNYTDKFSAPSMSCWMRPTSDILVMIGPMFQPIRGLIFALVFYPLREIFFGRKNGWLLMGWTLVALGILSTFGPPPGSVEGLLYTVIPLSIQLPGLLEVIPQAILLSAILYFWVNHPEKKWMNWVMGILFFVLMSFPILGLLAR